MTIVWKNELCGYNELGGLRSSYNLHTLRETPTVVYGHTTTDHASNVAEDTK